MLLYNAIEVNVVTKPRAEGITPVSLLLSNFNFFKYSNFPSVDGIDPESLFELTVNTWRVESSPSIDGIVPLSCIYSNRSTVVALLPS